VVAIRLGRSPSTLLMPLAFGAHAGSMLALTGTPVNVIVSDALADTGDDRFGFFEFALVGIPLVIGTVLFLTFCSRPLLPVREGSHIPLDLVRHARILRQQYSVDLDTTTLVGPRSGITELLIAPRSPLIGTRIFTGMATPQGDLVVLAARRGDTQLKGDVTIQVGDALLMQGRWDDLARQADEPGVMAVHSPQELRRSVPLGRGAKRTLIILAVMVVLLATGIVPPAIAALLAACALVLARVVKVSQAYGAISWTTVVLIAGMIPLSTAFTKTGAADLLAGGLLSLIGDAGPYVALAALSVLTLVLSQLISNAATVLILAPIAMSLAAAMEVSVQPFLMGLAVVAAAAFLTPVATPANLMVMDPAGYRFGDYWRLGLPLSLFFLAMGVFYVPLIWPF
jgi:di/tricarboxylate transporter